MRLYRTETISLFLFTILLISGIACPQAAASNVAYIDEHNRFILNGNPFFPIGLYVVQCTNGDYAAELQEIDDSPFDTLMNYNIDGCEGDATDDQIINYLDQLQIPPRNLKLIYSLKKYIPYDRANHLCRDIDINSVQEKVRNFKDHPAVISWYLNDEVGSSEDDSLKAQEDCVAKLLAGYEEITSLDGNHPVWSVHWDTSFWNPDYQYNEVDTTDIVGIDPYPIAHLPITNVRGKADEANAAGKPLWLVPQIFSWEDYRGDFRAATGRPPTQEEMRAMTYLATNHGAKGLIYYSYRDIRNDGDFWDRWPQIKEIASEIDQLRSVFLSTYQTGRNQVTRNNDDIDLKLMWADNTYYLFAVNTKAPSEIIIDNPDPNVTYVGDWPTVQGDPQGDPPTYPYGGNFQQNPTLNNGDTATWTADITEAGDYRVYARWTADTDRATNARYTINYNGGFEQVTVNQQANGDRWTLLGTYPFASGTSGSVVLTDNANGVVIADAIMWLLKEGDVTSVSFQINLGEKPTELETRFEDGRRLPVTNGKFTESFNTYEVHIYHWQGDFEEPPSGGSSGGSSSSGGGCFIATAAFGSYVNPHVRVIKDFRDEYLLTNMPGRWFVGIYKTYGPFWADLLNAHPRCKPFVRLALMPVVGTSYFLVKTSLAIKLLTGFLMMGFVVICVLRIHSRSE